MELGCDTDRREEAQGSLTASHRSIRTLLAALALIGALQAPDALFAATPANCTLAKIAEWQVRSTRGQPVVDGTINGEKVGALIDTGASRSIILRAAADRLRLVRYNARGGRMIGVGGESNVETASIDELVIGDAVRRNWRMLVAGEHEISGDIAVILGEDFFYRADVEFDLAHNAMRLFQARGCEGKSLAYWATEGAGVVGFEAIFEAAPSIELTVEINGRPVTALLDSGAYPSVVTKSQAAVLGVKPESAGVVAGGCGRGLGQKTVEIWFGPFESFRIGDELIRNPTISFSDIWKFSTYKSGSLTSRPVAAPDMLLGADFLRSHRVLIAHSQRKIYFTHAGGTVFQVEAPQSCDEIERREAEKRQVPAQK